MAVPQPGIFAQGTRSHHHLELDVRADATHDAIVRALRGLREPAVTVGGSNIVVGFGADFARRLLPGDVPSDVQPFPGVTGSAGSVPATPHDVWVWAHGTGQDVLLDVARAIGACLAPVAVLAAEQAGFVYHDSRDLTGFIDGTGNPEPDEQHDRAIIPDGSPGAGGSFCIAQRWVHDLGYFNGLSLDDQQNTFGRTKADSTRLDNQVPTSHLSHVELRDGETADASKPKRGEMVRRSTPYAFHDGTVGLYFMGFCREQAPLRERMEAIYGMNGQARDALTDYSTPASGSFYFAPSHESLDAMLA